MNRVRTLLVAANVDFLESLADWMAQHPQLEVVERAHSGEEALERLGPSRAELVLMDVTLPDTSGFQVASEMKSRPGAPLVILLSFFDSRAVHLRAWAAGADGILLKSEMTERLTPLVAEVLGKQQAEARPNLPIEPSKRAVPADVSGSTGSGAGERGRL